MRGPRIIPEGSHMGKRRYSCFEGTELEAILRSLGVSRVAICVDDQRLLRDHGPRGA